MGSSFSALCHLADGETKASRPSLGDMPEDCVSLIIAHLDPPEICRFARINKAFCGAATADFIWESKLPENHGLLFEKLFGYLPVNLAKKEIYTWLCRDNLFEGGTKKAWLDKRTGGLCLSVSAKGLAITGIDDRRYWNHILTNESRFNSIAYVQQTWWLEVEGELEFPLPAGAYSLFFKLQLGRASRRFGRRVCNSEHVHGWDKKPVRFQLWTADGQHSTLQCFLNEPGRWVYYHAGNFVVHDSHASTKLKFSMTQIDCTHTKGGLCLDSAVIRPSEL